MSVSDGGTPADQPDGRLPAEATRIPQIPPQSPTEIHPRSERATRGLPRRNGAAEDPAIADRRIPERQQEPGERRHGVRRDDEPLRGVPGDCRREGPRYGIHELPVCQRMHTGRAAVSARCRPDQEGREDRRGKGGVQRRRGAAGGRYVA